MRVSTLAPRFKRFSLIFLSLLLRYKSLTSVQVTDSLRTGLLGKDVVKLSPGLIILVQAPQYRGLERHLLYGR